jgi:hypothetical protein
MGLKGKSHIRFLILGTGGANDLDIGEGGDLPQGDFGAPPPHGDLAGQGELGGDWLHSSCHES